MVAPVDEPKAPVIVGYKKFCEHPTKNGLCGDWHARFIGKYKRCIYHMPTQFVKPYHWRWWVGWFATIDRWGDQDRPLFDECIRDKQGGHRCAICRRDTPNLVLDHDHTWSTVRGLLCYPCNSGSLLDRGDLYHAAVKYKAAADYSLRNGLEFALGFSSAPRTDLERILDQYNIRDQIRMLSLTGSIH